MCFCTQQGLNKCLLNLCFGWIGKLGFLLFFRHLWQGNFHFSFLVKNSSFLLQQQLEYSCLVFSQSQTCSPSKCLLVQMLQGGFPPSQQKSKVKEICKTTRVLNYSCLFITDLQPVQYKTYSSISPLHKYLLTIYYIYKMLCSKSQKLV